MKKSFYIITAAALSLVACSRNQEVDVPDANLSIFARTESPADTKTVVESGVHVFWEPGDEITVFMGEQSAKFTTDITAASGTATFKGTFGDTTWPEDLDLWAVYPLSEDAVFDGETITTVLPSEQVARDGSFGKDMNLAIAHSNSSTLQFYNVGGGIRFSVTEEGIKKVMFEGLSGEIISGKVKIGFEDGFPVVKEVSGGSQFITLLPPAGSETFQKDTWYYIVAIPGALEGGYKLRFYKDSDYARKVSEKAVEIKRSIYGSVEKADSGIDFEPKTTHFPRTEEEIDYSLDLAESIAEVAQRIVDTEKNESQDGTIDAQAIADALLLIDGVIYAEPSSDVAVKVMQKDSLFFNVVLQSFVVDDESKTRSLGPISSVPSKNQALSDEKGICTPQGKEAIILMPVYDEAMYYFRKDGLYDYGYNLYSHFKQYLENCGYHVDEYKNDQASLERFRGKKLQDYDVVFIHSHGGYNLCLADGTGEYTGWMTATQVKDNVGKRFFGVTDFCDSCISLYDGKLHYWITMPAIKRDNPSFHNTFFYIFACHGARKTDMYLYLCERGAAAYCGHTDVAKVFGSPEVADAMLFSLTSGQSLWDAYDWTLQHTIKHDGNIPTHDLVHLHCYQENKEETFYLFDPYPYDLSSDVNGSKVTLKWKLPLHSGRYSYQLYIKDSPIGIEAYENETNEYTYEYTANSPGSYSWYVKSNLRYNGEVISSFRTDGEDFTIKEDSHYETPEAIDLGLPSGTKWASFNLGATKPEEYGYYYAWGETEPKASYSWSNYKWCKGTDHTLTKYCTDSSSGYEGFVDNKTKLDLSDDAARVNLQGYFRTPTCDEMKELFENSSVEWTNSYHGTGEAGYILTSNVPGYTNNSVFLPFAGDSRGNQGQIGNYMMSETTGCVPQGFNSMYLKSDIIYGGGYMNRIHVGSKAEGTTIRPVYPTQVKQITIVPTQTSSYVGNQIVLSTETVPENASHNYVWSSSNESIAKVFSSRDNTCRINLVSPGVATITVTALDGNVSASCQVIVKEEEPKAIINISPTEINYGDVKVGEGLGHETGRVTFTNTGNADLSIFFIDCPDGFSHSTGYTFPIVISPGNDKTIVFAFKPTEVKTYSGYIQVYTNASNGGGTIKVTGNGIE